ncbi:TdeIII family type II restriction endonuclease [Vibrio fluminensis]|uniref:TdeIII family type II restriction endonuclease n=1 Tax=Vibrio fluminensis TaxID=2783614 RepID=UPI001E5D3381|nr:TdeIII family type II restriction endonuclease [Vibrio fluminensis]
MILLPYIIFFATNTVLTNQQIQELISETVSHNVHDFFRGKEVKTTHMLDHIFPKERKIRSLIGGLETSMGTRVWEPLAKAFAESNGFEVLNEKAFNQRVPVIPDDVTQFISLWEKKKIANKSIPLSGYWTELKEYIEENVDRDALAFQKMPKGQGVDIILSKRGKLFLFDIKTTQLNAGGGPKFLKNFLEWYAYLALMDMADDANCFLAFPFDPHNGKFWSKEGGKVSPLIPSEEAYVADEFWDNLTGVTGTTEIIESTFIKLGQSGFGEQFLHHFE